MQPLMLIVPDVQDVYTPLQTDVIVQLSEVISTSLSTMAFSFTRSFYSNIKYFLFDLMQQCRQHLDLLLESIPTMFQNNKTADSAFGAGIKAAFMAMKSTGGKLLVFQSGKFMNFLIIYFIHVYLYVFE